MKSSTGEMFFATHSGLTTFFPKDVVENPYVQAISGVSDRARELAISTRNMEQDQVQVTVEDSGVGLDPEKVAKIFEPFYTTKSSGMGMGLSICRSIIKTH
ncbi:MAG: hypothetical protein JOZ22_14260, partial [Acidobacteriia bacterium]|nr:hypothetical protein [Terriglobia bacterium]